MARFLLLLSFTLLLSCGILSSQDFPPEVSVRFLALGDSFTYGESVARDKIWPVQFRDSLMAYGYEFEEMDVIAVTGWRTDELMDSLNNSGSLDRYNLVSLLIGVNNQYQGFPSKEYGPEFRLLLEKAIGIAGSKERVFVLSIPDYAYTPYGQSSNPARISEEVNTFNGISESITRSMGVRYFNITDISREWIHESDLVASDGLHPSARQYSHWVARILADVKPRP